MRARSLSIFAVLVAFSTTLRAENPPNSQFVTRVFHVADLVIPIPQHVKFGLEKPAATEREQSLQTDKLIECITGNIKPSSWSSKGGAGKIEFFKNGYALVVSNTPEVIAETHKLLESLRRLQETNIAYGVRLITVSAETDLGQCPVKEGQVAFLTDAQFKKMMETAQGDPRANVMQTPKVTAFNGQEAFVSMVEERFFVTGVEAHRLNGQTVVVPKNVPHELGTTLSLQGKLSADNKFVSLKLDFTNKRIEGNIELIPIVTQISPIMKNGQRGAKIPFTQFLESPQFETVKIEKKELIVPSGSHAVIAGPTVIRECREEFGVPILSEIPYVNRLFKNTGFTKSALRTILVVSPVVIEPTTTATAP